MLRFREIIILELGTLNSNAVLNEYTYAKIITSTTNVVTYLRQHGLLHSDIICCGNNCQAYT